MITHEALHLVFLPVALLANAPLKNILGDCSNIGITNNKTIFCTSLFSYKLFYFKSTPRSDPSCTYICTDFETDFVNRIANKAAIIKKTPPNSIAFTASLFNMFLIIGPKVTV